MSAKMPNVVKRAAEAAGTAAFPAAYAAAREHLEEITGALDDTLREDARIRAESARQLPTGSDDRADGR